MLDVELIKRLNNSGLGVLRISEIAGVSEAQMRLVLNYVSVLNPKIKKILLNSEELKELWGF